MVTILIMGSSCGSLHKFRTLTPKYAFNIRWRYGGRPRGFRPTLITPQSTELKVFRMFRSMATAHIFESLALTSCGGVPSVDRFFLKPNWLSVSSTSEATMNPSIRPISNIFNILPTLFKKTQRTVQNGKPLGFSGFTKQREPGPLRFPSA